MATPLTSSPGLIRTSCDRAALRLVDEYNLYYMILGRPKECWKLTDDHQREMVDKCEEITSRRCDGVLDTTQLDECISFQAVDWLPSTTYEGALAREVVVANNQEKLKNLFSLFFHSSGSSRLSRSLFISNGDTQKRVATALSHIHYFECPNHEKRCERELDWLKRIITSDYGEWYLAQPELIIQANRLRKAFGLPLIEAPEEKRVPQISDWEVGAAYLLSVSQDHDPAMGFGIGGGYKIVGSDHLNLRMGVSYSYLNLAGDAELHQPQLYANLHFTNNSYVNASLYLQGGEAIGVDTDSSSFATFGFGGGFDLFPLSLYDSSLAMFIWAGYQRYHEAPDGMARDNANFALGVRY